MITSILCALLLTPCPDQDPIVRSVRRDDRVVVTAGGKPFAEYRTDVASRPVIYPLHGPHGGLVVRRWPLGKAPGEAHDHPHHKSVWFAHGEVNGHDFWAEGKKRGRVEHVAWAEPEALAGNTVVTRNRWVAADGRVVCTDTRRFTFGASSRHRWIDVDVTIHASHGTIRFGDTKEGTMAIRLAPTLRLEGPVAKGHALNSEGVKGKAIWGKRARWVDYHGPVGKHTVGVAIFDHPRNHSHPTWWHARAYGLFAANPFGVRHFERKPRGTGDLVVENARNVRFRYRLLVHSGVLSKADLDALWKSWADRDR